MDPVHEENSDEARDTGEMFINFPFLVWENILKFLDAEQLLSLRRVCRSTNSWVNELSLKNAWDGYRLEITTENPARTFEAAVQSKIKITSVFINNRGSTRKAMKIYSSAGVREFIKNHGPYIRKLTVFTFGTLKCNAERKFFESLTNLEELSLKVVDATSRKKSILQINPSKPPLSFPENFRNLKKLKFKLVFTSDYETVYHWDLIHACTSLKYLRLPVVSIGCTLEHSIPMVPTPPPLPDKNVKYLYNLIRSGIKNLDVLDFKIANPSFGFAVVLNCIASNDFAAENRLKPLRVRKFHIAQLSCFSDEDYLNNLTWCHDLVRVVGGIFQPEILHATLHNLETFSLVTFKGLQIPEWPTIDLVWPKLKDFEIKITKQWMGLNKSWLKHFINLLIKESRPSVRVCTIMFDPAVTKDPFLMGLIKPVSLAENFRNITFLKMYHWDVKNVQFLKLWEGLSVLEELAIANCPTLGNVALIGENSDDPAFLKLKSLKKLSFYLNPMPLITDRAFQDVFSKMKLKVFQLYSDKPLQKITKDGILALLSGEFGRSIERFPFDGWSLASMTRPEFKKLGRKFRSIC